jgi:hypothetical protein
MKRPTTQQLDIAAEWLLVNNGNEGEAEACKAVADWLQHIREQVETSAAIKAVAKETGARVSDVRKAVRTVNAVDAAIQRWTPPNKSETS